VGDMARFGSILFQILAPIQLALITFLSAQTAASAISQEKDRRTLLLLLMTRMSNRELVLGKLGASLLNIWTMCLAALPVLLSITLFGGVSLEQVAQVFLVTLTTSLSAGSVGALVAFWREKTFQTLAMTALAILIWLGAWEAVHWLSGQQTIAGITAAELSTAMSPIRAIFAASRPSFGSSTFWLDAQVAAFLAASLAISALLNTISIVFVRRWNPSREVRPGQAEEASGSIWGAEHDLASESPADARDGHVDARVRAASTESRQVWNNPVLWREVCTWAYGRKVIVIRVAYLLLFAMTAAALYAIVSTSESSGAQLQAVIPDAAKPLAPFLLVSLVIINALAVTSVTNERDGQALDLLLVTDLSSKEFVFGKLWGVFYVAKEMLLLPLLLVLAICWYGVIGVETLLFLLAGQLVMVVFATTLGLHCGMTYANSRTAVGVSLGTLFFLFLGVVTCMVMMISFSGSFQTQLPPFLAFILGGGVGLYVALGSRNPSQAILLASLLLPIATFHAITSFLLGHSMTVFIVTTAIYGFTVAAMMMPAIGEFDIAMGRTKTAGEE
ncbi:MAG: ABC transporter permease, partial [Pirellulaceae bacterium]|nr:ABC transporter permease [Pirellulaceae bacterium]